MRAKILMSTMLMMAVVALSSALAKAQPATQPKFKAGDAVEVDTFMRGDYPGAEKLAKWQKATIVRIENPGERLAAYVVKLDEDGREMRIHFTDSRWIRAPQNTAANTADETKPGGNTQPNQTAGTKTDQPAANQTHEFKVGDRVEVDRDHIGVSSPADKQVWKAATVTGIDRSNGDRPVYLVQFDPLPGQLPGRDRIPITPNQAERVWIRALGGTAPNIPTDKLRVDANDTVLADRDVLDCAHLQQPDARNGSPLPAEEAKRLIRCAMGENPSQLGGEGATKVDITQFSIGAPRTWDRVRDWGRDATANTIVYPVRAKLTIKSFYREKNTVLSDIDRSFTCHVDVGHWVCGPDQVFKYGTQSQIPVTK